MSQIQNKIILEKTSQLICDQCNENYDTVIKHLSDDIAYIGPMDFQWEQDIKAGRNNLTEKKASKQVMITNEEYKLHTHYRGMWVIYGRFFLITTASDGSRCRASMRATVIWRKIQDTHKVIHMHISASRDYPGCTASPRENGENYTEYATRYFTPEKVLKENEGKLALRDCNGHYHYLYEYEILCIEADKQASYVILSNEKFRIRKQISQFEDELSSDFMRIHKSYLVNLSHITDIWLYHLRLANGQELPVSRSKYSVLKKQVKQS